MGNWTAFQVLAKTMGLVLPVLNATTVATPCAPNMNVFVKWAW